MEDTATALAEAATGLQETVRSHKRAVSFHRRQAREAMERLALLRARAAALGIEITVNTRPQGGRSGRTDHGG